jgi:pSer/pThr/pTyr-binding forkhead associated (FHA) protein
MLRGVSVSLTVQFDPERGWIVEDSSSNGTYVDGAKVSQYVVGGHVST